MARNVVTEFTDDLVGVVVMDENEIRMEVPVSFDGREGTLDLLPATYEAVRALLMDKDAGGVRVMFAVPETPVRRSKEEVDEIRRLARDAGLDVKDSGRLSKQVEAWYAEKYLPSLVPAENTADGTETSEDDTNSDTPAPAPRKTRRS